MERAFLLVCDQCLAFRSFTSSGACTPASVQTHPLLAEFSQEHDDCRPPLRITGADDASVESYREHYEEA